MEHDECMYVDSNEIVECKFVQSNCNSEDQLSVMDITITEAPDQRVMEGPMRWAAQVNSESIVNIGLESALSQTAIESSEFSMYKT